MQFHRQMGFLIFSLLTWFCKIGETRRRTILQGWSWRKDRDSNGMFARWSTWREIEIVMTCSLEISWVGKYWTLLDNALPLGDSNDMFTPLVMRGRMAGVPRFLMKISMYARRSFGDLEEDITPWVARPKIHNVLIVIFLYFVGSTSSQKPL